MKNKLLNNYLKNNNKISKIFTKVLICLIILISTLIYMKASPDNKNIIKKYVFDNNFNFSSFRSFYNKITNKNNSIPVIKTSLIEYISKEKYLDGEKYLLESEQNIETISSGIIVFIGEKEGFNNTIIIQDDKGFDIWYGNIENVNNKIYDYVNSNSILGTSKDKFYLKITKDNENYTYEKYLHQIA